MTGEERRNAIIDLLDKNKEAVSGLALSKELGVSRQIIVQDIALLRAMNYDIYSTNKGYILNTKKQHERILKLIHTDSEVETELNTIVDLGGWVKNVFVYHKVYNVVSAEINIKSRKDIKAYLNKIEGGKSLLLMNVTSGYHYHTIVADDEETLDLIQNEMMKLGFLAKLQEYEPINFWRNEENDEGNID